MAAGLAAQTHAQTPMPYRTEKPLCPPGMAPKDAGKLAIRVLTTPLSHASQAQANNCIVIAALGGDVPSQAMLGEQYALSGHYRAGFRDAPVLPQDIEAALYWLNTSAAAGSADAAYNLGRLAEYGLGLPQDDAVAIKWYEKAQSGRVFGADTALLRVRGRAALGAKFLATWQPKADAGDTQAMLTLAGAYITGDPFVQSFADAATWLRKAADAGDATGQQMLARLYMEGVGVPKDKNMAVDLLLKASLGRDHSGNLLLVGLYTDADVDAAHKAAIADRAHEAAKQSGKPAFTDASPVPAPDPKPDMAEIERLAAKGDKDAEYTMGILYLGDFGDTPDVPKALDWLTRAAGHGSTDAMINLGDLSYAGKQVPQDYALALGWYDKAAVKGDGTGLYNAAVMYRDGLGTPVDVVKAYTYALRLQLPGEGRAQAMIIAMMPRLSVTDRASALAEAARMYVAWFQ